MSTEQELWKEPTDPILEAVADMVTEGDPEWGGSATELMLRLRDKNGALDIQPNALTRRLAAILFQGTWARIFRIKCTLHPLHRCLGKALARQPPVPCWHLKLPQRRCLQSALLQALEQLRMAGFSRLSSTTSTSRCPVYWGKSLYILSDQKCRAVPD